MIGAALLIVVSLVAVLAAIWNVVFIDRHLR